ncbi:NAD(P)/FAD-dependent oxidoreductase [Streptomyces mirabilis]|uniref:NAD(P)/FAD-dependent oxidoreductase n=1 Tax=Streptomyces mirabilis TaxID=68239 RepID=UPI0036740F53
MKESIAVVGANLAGGRAAQTLRKEGFEGDIHLIGMEPHPPYERPVLSKEVLLENCDPAQAYLQTEDAWEQQGIQLRLSTVVTRIHRQSRQLELSDGGLVRANKVLLCTGGRVRRLPVPGAELEGVEYLRTIDDAVAVRDRLQTGAPVVVIGGGFIGAEVAACAKLNGCEVTMLEAEDVPLWRVLGHELGGILCGIHRDQGVHVKTKTTVDRIEGNGRVTNVVTSEGERIEASTVVIGVGITPATELAEGAGLEVGNGIMVNEFCETSIPGIYAAGDVANHPNAILGGRVRLESWQNAQKQATAAAKSMLGESKMFNDVPWFWSDQYDLNIQMSGQPDPTDSIVYRGDKSSRSFSAFFLRDGVLRSVVAFNRARDVKRTMTYIASRQILEPAQLGDESVDLRRLGD